MNVQKPILHGLNYTTQALSEAVANDDIQARTIKYIPQAIEQVDEFIKRNAVEVSKTDRDDMIQEAILAFFQKARKLNKLDESIQHKAVKSRLNEIRDVFVRENDNIPLTKISATYTIKDVVAKF